VAESSPLASLPYGVTYVKVIPVERIYLLTYGREIDQ
jgi:hypothetical protein